MRGRGAGREREGEEKWGEGREGENGERMRVEKEEEAGGRVGEREGKKEEVRE